LKYFYPEEFKIENYERGNEDYDYWQQNYDILLLNNDGHTPPPQKGYSESTFSTSCIHILSQPSHDHKPYSRNKPKKKYKTLDDKGSEISMFINIRSQIEIYNEDGKGYVYAVLSQLCPKSWGKVYL
jgi:hypothetical protein